jgi:hypothetical protein
MSDVAKRLIATGKWSDETALLRERAGHLCEYCGARTTDTVIPAGPIHAALHTRKPPAPPKHLPASGSMTSQ